MINFRYHLVSLVAVFLALALGVVVGVAALNGPVLHDLRAEAATLKADKRALEQTAGEQRRRVDADNRFAAAVAPTVVAGRLKGASVVLVATSKVPGPLTDAVQTMLRRAGATVTGRVQLTDGYTDPTRATELKAYATGDGLPAGLRLPESDSAGVLGAAVLSQVLIGRTAPKDVTQVLAGLAGLQLLRQDGDVTAAEQAVLLTTGQQGGDTADSRLGAITALAGALDHAGRGAVVAGDRASAAVDGVLGRVRADQSLAAAVSTVDTIDGAVEQVALVYALAEQRAGHAGQYGVAPGAQAALPSPQR